MEVTVKINTTIAKKFLEAARAKHGDYYKKHRKIINFQGSPCRAGFGEIYAGKEGRRVKGWLTSQGNFLGTFREGGNVYLYASGRRHGIPWYLVASQDRQYDSSVSAVEEVLEGRKVVRYETKAPGWKPWETGDDHLEEAARIAAHIEAREEEARKRRERWCSPHRLQH